MAKYNVKKTENTNTMTTILETSCKKRDTAINRFCRFLSEYDNCFKDSLLIALMTIHFDCIVDDSKQYKTVTETDEYYMTYTECGDIYQVIIEFKHDENTTHYKSLANTSVSDNTNNETATDNNTKDTESDTKDTESDTNDTNDKNNFTPPCDFIFHKTFTFVSYYHHKHIVLYNHGRNNKPTVKQSERLRGINMNHYEETTTYKCYEFTTNCKKLTTALNRMMKIYPAIEQDIRELKNSYEWYNGDFNECDDTTVFGDKQLPTYRFIVEFDGEHCYICMYYYINNANSTKENDNETTDNTNNETATDNNTKDTESDTKDTESDTKDTESDTNDTNDKNNFTPQPCHIKAYYDGKELTIPYNEYKCKECAIEYIRNLYVGRVIHYDTLFMLYYGKHVETITIDSVLDITELIEYNIDDINNGLKKDCYKKVRQGFERICDIINGANNKMKICLDIHSGINVYYYTITKSGFEGLNTFKSDNMNRTQSSTAFARWLYYRTCVNSIELKCWYYD